MQKNDHSWESVGEAGRAIYEQRLRSIVEIPENIGKVIDIDVDTGDYEIDEDGMMANRRLRERRPGARIYGIRIGYNAMYAIGNTIERTTQ